MRRTSLGLAAYSLCRIGPIRHDDIFGDNLGTGICRCLVSFFLVFGLHEKGWFPRLFADRLKGFGDTLRSFRVLSQNPETQAQGLIRADIIHG